MIRLTAILAMAVMGLAACDPAPTPSSTLLADGKPAPRVYRIGAAQAGQIQIRVLDSVNSLRRSAGLGVVRLNSQLNASAATHARDMSAQNRPWHFGSDGSSPIDRARRVGYANRLLGEVLSETYETEVQTLAAWMEDPATRAIIMDPAAQDMGFSWFQETNGKIWWVLNMGA